MLSLLFLLCSISAILRPVAARKWNDTGKGSIAFEEAWTIPELVAPTTDPVLAANLLDIHNQRLAQMDETGIDYMVLSCAEPCAQGISDQAEAEAMARNVNDQLAAAISNNTFRFGGFATLAMHNATTAALELQRAVRELGFLGALLNDYQQSGSDNEDLLYYDQPEYDVFWEMVTELDVPIYFHPRSNIQQLQALEYQHSVWLLGPGQEFAATLSTHILGLCANGVFDRFPKLNIIVGHLGERIPSDLTRIDAQLARQLPLGMPMLRNASSYWKTNLFETTSGNFATELVEFHGNQIGMSRIMYSVDYPFIPMETGQDWLKDLEKTMEAKDLVALKRGLAVEVLHLDR